MWVGRCLIPRKTDVSPLHTGEHPVVCWKIPIAQHKDEYFSHHTKEDLAARQEILWNGSGSILAMKESWKSSDKHMNSMMPSMCAYDKHGEVYACIVRLA